MTHTTEQEAFWHGEFGDAYTDRKQGTRLGRPQTSPSSRRSSASRATCVPVLELGSNVGLNLMALRRLLPAAGFPRSRSMKRPRPNWRAALPEVDLHRSSILEFESRESWDLVFTKGVLIHVNPDKLPIVYELMRCAAGYHSCHRRSGRES